MQDDPAVQHDQTAAEQETPVIGVADDAALLAVAAEVVEGLLGIELVPGPEGSLCAATEAGTVFVAALGDLIVTLELCVGSGFVESPELLAFLNQQNAASIFVRFSVLDEQLWVSANVDGNPFLPLHLSRVLAYMIEAGFAIALVGGEPVAR